MTPVKPSAALEAFNKIRLTNYCSGHGASDWCIVSSDRVLDKHFETIRTAPQSQIEAEKRGVGEDVPIVAGTREAIIQKVEDEMGYYDIPEAEPNITFTGKTVCDLVDLAKTLMIENDEIEAAAHEKDMEIIRLKKIARHPSVQDAGVA